MDDTGAYKVEISNESGAASGAFKMKVVSKCPVYDFCFEPVHEKTNNLDFDQVRHKPSCTITEDG